MEEIEELFDENFLGGQFGEENVDTIRMEMGRHLAVGFVDGFLAGIRKVMAERVTNGSENAARAMAEEMAAAKLRELEFTEAQVRELLGYDD